MANPVEARLRTLESQVAGNRLTAKDSRDLIRVVVTGDGRVHEVELDPRWSRRIQPQNLDKELLTLVRNARESAAEATRQAYETAGLVVAVTGHAAALSSLEHVHGGAEYLQSLATEMVTEEFARGRIAVGVRLSGELESLHISTRHAMDTDPARLGTEIRDALLAVEAAAEQRRTELARALTGGRPAEALLQERAERFRHSMQALIDQLP